MSVTVPLHSLEEEQMLLGGRDAHARAIRNCFGVTLTVRKGRVLVDGDEEDVSDAVRVVRLLIEHIRETGELSDDVVAQHLAGGRGAGVAEPKPKDNGGLWLPPGVTCRSKGQEHYVRSMQRETATFAIGPAGTGKTYLAAACAVAALRRGFFRKLVLVRPAVEAGESLGFLPGDYVAKINPYLRPLYDALSAHLKAGQLQHFIETDVIEIAPLAYMRGRTLDKSFIILDEAQNTTPGQMKMFLTRMGQKSKVVVTGDRTQIDLPSSQQSGLIEGVRILGNVSGIGVVNLDRKDIVRHALVQRIVSAYENEEAAKERAEKRGLEWPEDGRGRR